MQPAEIFTALKSFVEPHLKAYKDDLMKHDFKSIVINNYNGKFLYAYRATGTSLLIMPDKIHDFFKPRFIDQLAETGNTANACELIQKEAENALLSITYTGFATIEFLYFTGTKFKTVTREQAQQIYRSFIDGYYCQPIQWNNTEAKPGYKLLIK